MALLKKLLNIFYFPQSDAGFSLLEVIFAISILAIALGSILGIQTGSLRASAHAKHLQIITLLARSKMNETQFELKRSFEEVPFKKAGNFGPLYPQYRWEREIKTLNFHPLAQVVSQYLKTQEGGSQDLQVINEVFKYFSETIREVKITIYWKKYAYNVATYWVKLNHEMQPL